MNPEKFTWNWKRRGLKWLREPIDRLFEIVTAIQPLAGIGMGLDETAMGRMLHPSATEGGGAGAALVNDYSFKIVDESDAGGAKVLIQDGGIWGPNNDDIVYPDGMPSDDTYVLGVTDNDEIWVGMSWTDFDPPTIVNAWIDHGPTTPDDTETETYVTIGYIAVDFSGSSPRGFPANQHCGDIIIQLPPYPQSDKFVLMADGGALIWSDTNTCTPP